jgi:putative thioredoxin
VRAHIALGELDQAEAVLNGAPAEISTDAAIDAAHAQLTLARKADGAGPVDELRAAVDADPDNHKSRIELANALMAYDDATGAVDELLESFRRDREWNDGAARSELFTIFDALLPTDPVVLNGRRKLSSMIFA